MVPRFSTNNEDGVWCGNGVILGCPGYLDRPSATSHIPILFRFRSDAEPYSRGNGTASLATRTPPAVILRSGRPYDSLYARVFTTSGLTALAHVRKFVGLELVDLYASIGQTLKHS